jgi:hypothetical protein
LLTERHPRTQAKRRSVHWSRKCGWPDQQNRLATLSTNVSHRVFQDITHDGLIETVTGARAASDAIVAAVMSVRAGTKLDGSTASQ